MNKKPFIIAAISSLVITAMMFVINYITYFGHPWFIYPAFAVAWWPLSVYFAGNKKYTMFSIACAILVTVFFLLVNLITSLAYPWFIFPVFLIWWWPLVMLTVRRKKPKLFSVIAAIYISVFFLIVNLVSSPNTVWFIYPAFAVIWWPLSQVLCGLKKYKLYSVVSSLYMTAFLALVNLLTSPFYIWFYYPAFVIAWWPLSMFFAKKYSKPYSVVMSIIIIGFLALINFMHTPDKLWFHQTIFFVVWWPVVTLLGKRAKTLAFAIVSAVVIIGYAVLFYYLKTPGIHPWYLYVIFPVVWWPVCVGFKKHIYKINFLIISIVLFLIYYGALNLLFSPGYFWSAYLVYPAIWAGMGMFFGPRKMYFGMSVCAAVVTIAFFIIVNHMTSPHTIWFVYPAFGILWWPLSMYYYKERKKINNTSSIKKAA